jgi:hypothetical protein
MCGRVADPADTPDMSGHTAAPPPPARARGTLASQLLRHSLVAPEKKTLKRLEAVRREHFTGDGNATALRGAVDAHLAADRSLAAALDADALALLATAMCDPMQASSPAATIVGHFLRAAGGIERSQLTPERVKAALQVLTDAIYDLEQPTAPIPMAVRGARIEKRDGGQQLVASLRHGADEHATLAVMQQALQQAGYGDIDVRAERPALVVSSRIGTNRPS